MAIGLSLCKLTGQEAERSETSKLALSLLKTPKAKEILEFLRHSEF
jgi:hypothetical protein